MTYGRNRTPAQQARLTITREQRRRVYTRDRHCCRGCGAATDLTLDHIHPLARTTPKAWVRDDELQTAVDGGRGGRPERSD